MGTHTPPKEASYCQPYPGHTRGRTGPDSDPVLAACWCMHDLGLPHTKDALRKNEVVETKTPPPTVYPHLLYDRFPQPTVADQPRPWLLPSDFCLYYRRLCPQPASQSGVAAAHAPQPAGPQAAFGAHIKRSPGPSGSRQALRSRDPHPPTGRTSALDTGWKTLSSLRPPVSRSA